MAQVGLSSGDLKMGNKERSFLFVLIIFVGLIGIPSAVHMFTSDSTYTYLAHGSNYLEAPEGGGSAPFLEDTQTKEWMEVNLLHNLGYKGDGINIAIIDSGLIPHDYFTTTLNTQLVKYIWVNDDYSMSKTSNWFSSYLEDNNGHGTKVTGTALQFAPESGLVFYSTEKQVGSVWVLDWYKVRKALQDLDTNYATYGVDVLSMSFGNRDLPNDRPSLAAEIRNLLESIASKGITIFIASGNIFDEPVSWPASIAPDTEGIFSVGGVFDQDYIDYGGKGTPRHKGEIWYEYDLGIGGDWAGTSHGYALEVLATSIDVMTTSNDGGGAYSFGGTSAAAPIAAGCVACLLELWNGINGFTTIPNDFIEGTIRNIAEYRYGTDPYIYGDGIVSPYDCRIYPVSIAGSSIHNGYMFTSYDAAFYGSGYSLYLEWWEKKSTWSWEIHNDLVLQTTFIGWNTYHAQNIIRPDFLQGYYATIRWRYKLIVVSPSMTVTTSWHTDTISGGMPW